MQGKLCSQSLLVKDAGPLCSLRRQPAALPLLALALVAIVASPQALRGQNPCSSQNAPVETDGIAHGDYMVHSSIEMGYRSTNLSGLNPMYDTLVDLQTGPRFLNETFSMDSRDHRGELFDSLFLTSCGWGGDPDNALRMRVDKNKWYSFHGTFRRDQYVSNYDLMGNPLNPSTSSPSIPALNSPLEFDTTRRMTDVDLMLLPQSRVSFRLGYSHNNMTGPTYDAIHEGTEGFLLNPWNTSMNSYRMGADWKLAPRTVLSYDELLDYYRGDTDTQLASFSPTLLSNGTPVDLGLSFDTANSEPCALAKKTTTLISNGVLTNNNCSGYFSYGRDQRVRTSTPTERVSLRSNYFQRVDLVGSFSYSNADMSTPLDETFNGLITRTFTRAFTGTGIANATRISDVGDAEATVHLSRHFRLVDRFYFWAYRIPQNANFNEIDSDCTVHATCSLLTALTATTATAVPTLALSSFNQTVKRNQSELDWDVSPKIGARVGYRYGDRLFTDFASFAAGGENSITVHENTALAGIWLRPVRSLRFNFDAEDVNYDNVIVPIAPRKEARYRFQTGYNPVSWAVISGSLNLVEDSNNYTLTNYLGHNRNYGLTASLAPRGHLGMDLAYNYNDMIQNANVCFADTPPTGAVLPFVNVATKCLQPLPTGSTTLPDPLENYAGYTNHTQFGMGLVRFRFDKRTLINAGGSVTNVDGSIPQFNILQPQGTAQYRFYQPVVYLTVDLGHKLAWNSGFNYFQYDENSFVGPTNPRYFHANNITESLRYCILNGAVNHRCAAFSRKKEFEIQVSGGVSRPQPILYHIPFGCELTAFSIPVLWPRRAQHSRPSFSCCGRS